MITYALAATKLTAALYLAHVRVEAETCTCGRPIKHSRRCESRRANARARLERKEDEA